MLLRKIREYRLGGRAGFTLIELAIVLAVTSLLTAGLWRMMSSGNTQLRDQAAADQHKQLINAVRAYLASSAGQTRLTAASGPFAINLNAAGADAAFASYRPAGFTAATTNAYGQLYQVRVAKEPATAGVVPTSYRFMIKTINGAAGESIPDTSGGRISSMIGSDGGFVYAASVCGAPNVTACGAFGTWSSVPTSATEFAYPSVTGGQIASRTFVGSSAELQAPWLARLDMDAGSSSVHELNTIHTDISLDGNVLLGSDTATFGGAIDNLGELSLSSIGNLTAPSLSVTRLQNTDGTPHCSKLSPSDAACNNVAEFTGDVSVQGLLSATRLYADQFVYNNTSDRRLKHDITPLTGVLDKMAQIKGYSFLMNSGNAKKLGVIAQEVEPIYPELVIDIGDGYKGVDYIGLIGPLIAAVNELREQNVSMKALVEKQEREINELKSGKSK